MVAPIFIWRLNSVGTRFNSAHSSLPLAFNYPIYLPRRYRVTTEHILKELIGLNYVHLDLTQMLCCLILVIFVKLEHVVIQSILNVDIFIPPSDSLRQELLGFGIRSYFL